MRVLNLKFLIVGFVFTSSVCISSCKGKQKDETNTTDTTIATPAPATPAPAPVEISADDTLRQGVTDAVKDFPGVNATVNNGEITLTGEIRKNLLPSLMRTLNTLKPKRINNQLTVK